jgi:hypothetical protein
MLLVGSSELKLIVIVTHLSTYLKESFINQFLGIMFGMNLLTVGPYITVPPELDQTVLLQYNLYSSPLQWSKKLMHIPYQSDRI